MYRNATSKFPAVSFSIKRILSDSNNYNVLQLRKNGSMSNEYISNIPMRSTYKIDRRFFSCFVGIMTQDPNVKNARYVFYLFSLVS